VLHFKSAKNLIRYLQRRLKGKYEIVPDFIEKNFKSKKWKVISLVRDPVARQVSDFIKNGYDYFPNLMHPDGKPDIQKSLDHLESLFRDFDERKDYACTWFDQEMKTVFGVDIFAHTFDKQKGYTIITDDNVDLLLITLESMNECFVSAMREFFGLSDIQMIKANVSANGSFASEYKAIVNNFRLPADMLDKIYFTRFTRHFYSDLKIGAFKNKWLKS